MYAIVTGMGRGKTRTLLEIDRALKLHREIVSIAVTFNRNFKNSNRFPNPRINYLHAIVSLIIATHYRVPSGNAAKFAECIISDILDSMRKVGLEVADEELSRIISGLVHHIVVEQRRYRDVDRFVLLLDEVFFLSSL